MLSATRPWAAKDAVIMLGVLPPATRVLRRAGGSIFIANITAGTFKAAGYARITRVSRRKRG